MTTKTATLTTQTETRYVKVGEKGKMAAELLAEVSELNKLANEKKELAVALAIEAGMSLEPNVIGTYHGVPVLKTRKHTDTRANLKDLAAAFPEAYDATVKPKVTYYIGV